MKAVLVIPKSEQRKLCTAHNKARLNWTADHPASSYGLGVLLYRNGHVLSGFSFRDLRDYYGAAIETDDPEKVCRALGLQAGEPGVCRVR